MNPFDSAEELKAQQIEFRIHCAIVEQFNGAFSGAILWHTPNRGGGGADGHFKKMMGARKGASDLGLSWNDGKLRCGWYEIKAPGKKPTPDQNKWLSIFRGLGWETDYGTSVKHAFDTFERWGVKRRHHSVVEPDTRSDMKKKADGFDWFAP